jgi:glutaredoxin
MKLTVYSGKNCPRCPAARKVCQEVAKEKSIDYEDRNIEENMIEALQLQIASTPSIVLDDEVLFRSTAPTREELIREIETRWE